MQFNTYSYLLFLAIAAIVFWSLPVRLRRAYVLVVSLLFYASWNVYFLVLPLIICASTYVCAMMARRRAAEARVWIWSGVGFVLCVLVFFKYRTFLVTNLSAVTGASKFLSAGMVTGVVLPLGISFYSFEAMSYLFDSQQGRVSSTSFLDLALFIMFWPHLIAGPIVRVRELVPQLKFDGKFEIGFVLQGLDRLVWGLVQKNVFANSIGPWVDNGFVPGAAPLNTALDNWFLAAAFGLQIYFDFAAYTNIAIGSAQLIGIKLPENFRYPYHAVTPPEFWSRWHMTLSRWIRDYLFFPLT